MATKKTTTPAKKAKTSNDQKLPSKARNDHGIKNGYRSGLEASIAEELQNLGIPVYYETFKIPYIEPESQHKYTPDFILPNGIIIESKGRFMPADRAKHLLVKEQYPELDIRFVFTNHRAKICKNSDTTLAMWCDKYGFKYAKTSIPKEWIDEPVRPVEIPQKQSKRNKK